MRNLFMAALATSIVAGVYFSGMMNPPKPPLPEGAFIMACPNIDETVINTDPAGDKITFDFDRKSYTLPRVQSGSGEKFANSEIEYWINETEVSIILAATPDETILCSIN